MQNTNTLLIEVHEIVKRHSETIKKSGQNFNLFTLLRKEHDEVHLHSKFISELLNTKGSHEHGSLFLDELLVQLKINDFVTEDSISIVEHYTGIINEGNETGGNIDILIRSKTDSVIKIENKIYAGEQPNQLLRYHNYQKNGFLIFLTLDGKESVDHKDLIRRGISYKQVSYKDDITKWLEACIQRCEIPIIKESIRQYLYLVKKLTNQNNNMNQDIVEKVTQSKDSFAAYLAIRKTEKDIYLKVAETTLIPFFESFAMQNNLEVVGLKDSLITDRGQYSGFHFTNPRLQEYCLSLSVQFEVSNNKNMYYGLSFNEETPKSHIVYERILHESKHIIPNVTGSTAWWLCSAYWNEYQNWGDIETVYKLAYGNFQSEFTGKMLTVLTMAMSVIENFENEKLS